MTRASAFSNTWRGLTEDSDSSLPGKMRSFSQSGQVSQTKRAAEHLYPGRRCGLQTGEVSRLEGDVLEVFLVDFHLFAPASEGLPVAHHQVPLGALRTDLAFSGDSLVEAAKLGILADTFSFPFTQRREADTGLYETIRRATRRLLEAARAALGALSPVLRWVGVGLLVISCALAVYLGTVLLARLAMWASFP